jgi:hypothetical protein
MLSEILNRSFIIEDADLSDAIGTDAPCHKNL